MYQVGKKYDLEMTQKVTMDMGAVSRALGQEGVGGKTEVNMKMRMAITCKSHSIEDQRTVTTKYARVAMSVAMGQMNMNYDSSDPTTADSPVAKQMQPLLGLEIVAIIDEKGKTVEIKGLEQMEAMQQFSPEQLKQMFNPAQQLGFPEGGVAPGDTWGHLTDLPMGKQIGKVKMNMRMKYEKDQIIEGVDCAVISYSGALDTSGKAEPAAAKMNVKDFEIVGTMIFDRANQVIKEGSSNGKMNLSMPNPTDPQQKLNLPSEYEQKLKMISVTDL